MSEPPLSPPPSDDQPTARNLLFGLLALQNGFIDREALLSAFNAWSLWSKVDALLADVQASDPQAIV